MDPLNQYADQVRQLAAQFGVGLADSSKASPAKVRGGTKIENLIHINRPNRQGHELVVFELWKWFELKSTVG